jgi:hypothetical protein
VQAVTEDSSLSKKSQVEKISKKRLKTQRAVVDLATAAPRDNVFYINRGFNANQPDRVVAEGPLFAANPALKGTLLDLVELGLEAHQLPQEDFQRRLGEWRDVGWMNVSWRPC